MCQPRSIIYDDVSKGLSSRRVTRNPPRRVCSEGRGRQSYKLLQIAYIEVGSSDAESSTCRARGRIYNIGNQRPVGLMTYISVLGRRLGRKADKFLISIQLGDAAERFPDVETLASAVRYRPSPSLQFVVRRLVDWYLGHFGRNGA
jgi:hypothetical protein